MNTTKIISIALSISIVLYALAFNTTSLFDILPVIAADLQLSPVGLQWAVNCYMLTATVLMLVGAKLTDFFIKKRIFLVGAIVFLLGTLLVISTHQAWSFFAGRGLQAVGLAILLPSSITLIKVTIPKENEILAFGIWSALLGLGFASGPTLGGFMTHYLHWDAVYLLTAIITVAGMIAVYFLVPTSLEDVQIFKFDFLGTFCFIAGLALFCSSLMQGQGLGWTSPIVLMCGAAGIILLIAFIIVEQKRKLVLIPLSLLKNPLLIVACLGNVAFAYALIITLSYVLRFLENPLLLHDSALKAGIGLLPLSLSIFAFSLGMNWIKKYIPNVIALIFLGYALIIAAYVLLALIGHQQTYLYFITPLFIMGAGIGFLQTNLSKFATEAVPKHQVGDATGVIWTSFYLSAAISVIMCGIIHDYAMQHYTLVFSMKILMAFSAAWIAGITLLTLWSYRASKN